jgi:hypothetical protein
MAETKFVVVPKNAVISALSQSEAYQTVQQLKDVKPDEEYVVLEVHPERPSGLGRDPDLYD